MANTSGANDFSLADRRNRHGHTHTQSFIFVYIPTRNYLFQQQQLLMPNIYSPHTVLVFVIPVIINLIQLKVQSKGNSPYDTDPMTMWFSVSCLLAYCLAYAIELNFGSSLQSPIARSLKLIRSASYLCGSLCAASLTSTIFPNKMKPIFYGVFVLLSTGGILHKYTPIRKLWKWIFQKFGITFFHQDDILPV